MLEAEVVDAGVQHSVRAAGGVAAGVARPPPRHEGGQGLGAEALQRTEQCILYCTVLYCTLLQCTLLQCTLLHSTVLVYYTVMHCTALYCIVLHCTALYCTILYCTALQVGPALRLPAIMV